MKGFIFLFSIIFALYSCSNDNSSTEDSSVDHSLNIDTTQENGGFYALKVGNSWTYKIFEYNLETKAYEESDAIRKLEVVEEFVGEDGDTYYKLLEQTIGELKKSFPCCTKGEVFKIYKDVSGNLVDVNGNIDFSQKDFSEKLLSEMNWGNLHQMTIDGLSDISVTAGDFMAVKNEVYAKNLETKERYPGTNSKYYADGIGLVFETCSFVRDEIPGIELRLASYTVK